MTSSNNQLQPLVALSALRRLIADPKQTREVFTIIRSLSGHALRDGLIRFTGLPLGRQILAEKRNLLETLQDREALEALPANSLARRYLSLIGAAEITADGLVEASEVTEVRELAPEMQLFATRQRDMHDLWHTITQYGTDELGEACLLAFTYAQTKNRGLGVICFVGCLKLAQHYGSGVFGAAWRAYRAGRNAAWLPVQDWEALLAQPIDEVRQQLNITTPDKYWDLREPRAVPT